jgi:hypothetical protein
VRYTLKVRVVALLAILAVFSVASLAQSTSGELAGTVTDPTGATVPGAKVSATNTATGVTTTTTTGSSGQYRLSNLLVGTYDLTVTAAGFTKLQQKGLIVELNKTETKNLGLEIGEASVTVDVQEAAPTIDTTTAQIQSTYDSKQLSDLPTATLGAGGGTTSSGVINLSLLSSGVATSGSVGVGSGPSVGGQRPRNNNFTIEGIDNNNKSITGPLVFVPNDAVSEFTLLQNQFSPEFGHSSGGQFNQVVRSGTNDFHGTIYEYFRNRNMNAADQQAAVSGTPLHPRYDQSRLGATFGGPIKRDKLFFFTNFEYNPLAYAPPPVTLYAPTAAGYSTLATIPGVSANNLTTLQRYLGSAATPVDPASLPNGAPVTVNGTTIPVGLRSLNPSAYQNGFYGVGSVDYNQSDKDAWRGRFIYNKTDGQDVAAQVPTFWAIEPNRYYLATLSEYHMFSPTMTNEFRLGYNRYHQIVPTNSNQIFPGLTVFPNLYVNELNLDLGPDDNAPQFTVQNNYQATDNLTWIKGSHTLKVGYDFRKLISPQGFTQRARGDYEWSTLEGYLTDIQPDFFFERTTGQVTYYGDQISNGAYVNDNWKVRPNITLNLGLRYEYTTVPYSERLQTLNAVSSVPGLISFKEPSSYTTAFQPRIGLAYSPGRSGNTSIRAGFGINYDQLFDNLGILSAPPQLQVTVDSSPLQTGFLAGGAIPDSASAGTLTPAAARAATSGYVPDQKLPKSIQWNFGIQHVFANNYTFEARYLGTRGINLPVQSRINVFSPVTPTNSLPLFLTQPSQATLNSLPLTLGQLSTAAGDHILPAYAAAGFESYITAFMPVGNSTYHGLATSLSRRFSNGLQFTAAYTWSHNIDDSTAEVFSTVTTPRRPQDFQHLNAERADSALDHRQRATLTMLYDLPFFKGDQNWFLKNVVGNWEFVPVYTYQTGSWATLQSVTDSNLNGDSATDRVIVNPAGSANVGSGVTPLTNSAGGVVGYLADNPNARYITAGRGMYPNAARNTYQLPPIQNVDFSLMKRFNITERLGLQLIGQASNLFNHPQYIGGWLNDVAPANTAVTTSVQVRNFLNPANSTFNRPDLVFPSNPRILQIAAKFTF